MTGTAMTVDRQAVWLRLPQRHVVWGWCSSDITVFVVMRACVCLLCSVTMLIFRSHMIL
jgi:hypothetical protein